MPALGFVLIIKPCTRSTTGSFNVGDNIAGEARYEIRVPPGETYRYTVRFAVLNRRVSCETLSPSSVHSGSLSGSILGPLLTTWTQPNAQAGSYEARAEVIVERKLNGNYGPDEKLEIETCPFVVGGGSPLDPSASISDLTPCGTQEPVGQLLDISATSG